MVRGLAWLGAGLVAFVAVVVLSAPELALRDVVGTGQLVLFAGIAGVPGVILLLAAIVKRRGRADADDVREP